MEAVQSQQPNAQPTPPPPSTAGAGGGSAPTPQPQGSTTALGGTPPPSAAPTQDDTQRRGIGGNGGPEWEDAWLPALTEGIEEGRDVFSRYKSPAEFGKAFLQQRKELSKRAEPVKITPESTPEQIAAYRKAMGVPSLDEKAEPAKVLEAYEIKAPDGYEMGAVETKLLGDYVRTLNGKHHSPEAVRDSVAEFFRAQQAVQAQSEQIAAKLQKEWQNEIRDSLGSKVYEERRAAANAYLAQEFDGEKRGELANFVNAQLPGGGRLGDHPWFFKIMTEMAQANGHLDRIETAELTSSGKSLAEEQAAIEALRFSNRQAYDAAMASGGRYEKILNARIRAGEIDEHGQPIRRRA